MIDFIGSRVLANTKDVQVQISMLYRQLIFADFRQRIAINKQIKELKAQSNVKETA